MWYYLDRAQQQQGPEDDGRLQAMLADGTITPQTLVWREGLAGWIPLEQLPQPAAAAAAVGKSTLTACQVCNQPVGDDNLIELGGLRVCGACKPKVVQSLSEGVAVGSGVVWRDGKKIVARDGAVFPPRCLKCNAAASGTPMKRKLYWHNPWWYLVLLVPYIRLLIYIIIAVVVRKRATVEVYLCNEHKTRRVYLLIATWLTWLSGIVAIGWGSSIHNTWLILAGPCLVLTGIVLGIYARMFRTQKIKDGTVWLKGAGKPFLESLPTWNG
jgi:hypothetical protein